MDLIIYVIWTARGVKTFVIFNSIDKIQIDFLLFFLKNIKKNRLITLVTLTTMTTIVTLKTIDNLPSWIKDSRYVQGLKSGVFSEDPENTDDDLEVVIPIQIKKDTSIKTPEDVRSLVENCQFLGVLIPDNFYQSCLELKKEELKTAVTHLRNIGAGTVNIINQLKNMYREKYGEILKR